MSYFDGFIIPVPEGNRDAYLAMASEAATMFRAHGAIRVVEAWGDDIKPGKTNDFRTAVLAGEGEAVVFSFIEWPDRATRDAGWAAIESEPDMDMPFDGKRLIYGGFAPLLDIG
jgi:uncharacterized protein YbaA (DUF1428 family)